MIVTRRKWRTLYMHSLSSEIFLRILVHDCAWHTFGWQEFTDWMMLLLLSSRKLFCLNYLFYCCNWHWNTDTLHKTLLVNNLFAHLNPVFFFVFVCKKRRLKEKNGIHNLDLDHAIHTYENIINITQIQLIFRKKKKSGDKAKLRKMCKYTEYIIYIYLTL